MAKKTMLKNLKKIIESWISTEKVHKVIKFNQEAWLKPYIDINTKLRTESKNDFDKDFFKLMNDALFEKTMENVRNYRDIN